MGVKFSYGDRPGVPRIGPTGPHVLGTGAETPKAKGSPGQPGSGPDWTSNLAHVRSALKDLPEVGAVKHRSLRSHVIVVSSSRGEGAEAFRSSEGGQPSPSEKMTALDDFQQGYLLASRVFLSDRGSPADGLHALLHDALSGEDLSGESGYSAIQRMSRLISGIAVAVSVEFHDTDVRLDLFKEITNGIMNHLGPDGTTGESNGRTEARLSCLHALGLAMAETPGDRAAKEVRYTADTILAMKSNRAGIAAATGQADRRILGELLTSDEAMASPSTLSMAAIAVLFGMRGHPLQALRDESPDPPTTSPGAQAQPADRSRGCDTDQAEVVDHGPVMAHADGAGASPSPGQAGPPSATTAPDADATPEHLRTALETYFSALLDGCKALAEKIQRSGGYRYTDPGFFRAWETVTADLRQPLSVTELKKVVIHVPINTIKVLVAPDDFRKGVVPPAIDAEITSLVQRLEGQQKAAKAAYATLEDAYQLRSML